jgi:hypothetical protein
MSYSQQQQPQYRPNQAALWLNDRKTAANQPDYKGNVEISYATLQELNAAFNAGQYAQDRGGQPCIKLDFALYAQQGGQSASGKSKPILSGRLSTLVETQQSAAARQQSAQQYQQAQAPQGYPAQPQQPAPQYAPQQPAPQYAPAPAPQAPPQQYAPAPAAPAAPPAQPVYQQPQAPAPMAPPAPIQPMPGAIHYPSDAGQQRDMVLNSPDGSRPAPQYLPPGF